MAEPHVQHSLDGDARILSSTVGTRATLRTALTAFQNDVRKMGNTPVQIMADIKIRVGGEGAKEHTYNVTITSSDFDTASFTNHLPQSAMRPHQSTPGATTGRSAVPKQVNGLPTTPATSARKSMDDEDDVVVELRPSKRSKPNVTAFSLDQASNPAVDSLSGPGDHAKLVAFLESWKADWVQQGGWLYDNITKLSTATLNNSMSIEQKLGVVQDVLGQSMNSANSSTMIELINIAKLLSWVENCRQMSEDKSQAREEKWRTSNATFHDESRRDREAAEKRIEKKLEEHNDLLIRLARANSLDIDDADENSARASREESLGAQLTAELNQEASIARSISRYDKSTGTMTVDD